MRTRWLIILLVIGTGMVAGFWWRRTVLQERAETIAKNAPVEKTITIIPGWDLRDIAQYFAKEGIVSNAEIFFTEVVGRPAHEYSLTRQLPRLFQELDIYSPKIKVMASKPWFLSLEGYLAPDTYRIYKDAKMEDIIKKLLAERDSQFTDKMYADIKSSGRTVHEVLTIASILEKEVRTKEDKAKVADIFWRRHDVGMGLQADSTVHYATGKEGEVFTSDKDRQTDNFWNTYKYPKLPPGPISNPDLESIMAAVKPDPNDYWYFLTTLDTGEVKYAKTLAEHNENVRKFLKK